MLKLIHSQTQVIQQLPQRLVIALYFYTGDYLGCWCYFHLLPVKMMTVWDLDPERAGTTQQKIDCHVWSRPTLILALWLCDLLAQSLQLGSISLYIADKNHLPVWPLPWATTGISPVKRFRSRGAEVASKVESHWGCSSKKPTGLMRIKAMGCLWAVHWLSRPHTCTEIHGNRYPRAVGRPGPAQPVQSRSRGGAPPVTGNTSVPGLSLCEGTQERH